MTNNDLFAPEDLIGVESGDANYIGHRVAISLEAIDVPYYWMAEKLEVLGLARFTPREPSAADVFRRITGAITQDIANEDGTRTRLIVISVAERMSDGDIMERMVMMVNVDRANRQVSKGEKVAQLLFDRKSGEITVNYGYEHGLVYCPFEIRDIIDAAVDDYARQGSLLSFQQVRDVIQNILNEAGNPVWHKRKTNPPKQGIQIKSQYNIPVSREYLLFALDELSELLNQYADDNNLDKQPFGIDSLPVMNTQTNRDNMELDAMFFAIDRLNKLVSDEQKNIVAAKDTEAAKVRAQERYKAESAKVMDIINEYEKILGKSMEEVRVAKERSLNKLRRFCVNEEEQAEVRANLPTAQRKLRRNDPEKEFDVIVDEPPVQPRIIRAQTASPNPRSGFLNS